MAKIKANEIAITDEVVINQIYVIREPCPPNARGQHGTSVANREDISF